MPLADALEILIKLVQGQKKLSKAQKQALATVKKLAELVPAEGLIN